METAQRIRAQAFLDSFTGDYQYLTSPIKRDLEAANAIRAVAWSASNDVVAFIAPDRGGRVPAIFVRNMFSLLYGEQNVPPAFFCNLDPLWRYMSENPQYKLEALLKETDEERTERMHDLARQAILRIPGFVDVIGLLSAYKKKGVEPGVAIIDENGVEGTTLNFLKSIISWNGFPRVEGFHMHQGVANEYMHEPGWSHMAIPEKALGVVKQETGVSMMRPFPEEALLFRREMKRLATETVLSYQTLGSTSSTSY